MAKYITYDASSGIIQRTIVCDGTNIERSLRSNESYLEVTDLPNVSTHYVDITTSSHSVSPYPNQPTIYHTWNWVTLTWDAPASLTQAVADNTALINKLASDKILAVYPMYKQNNMIARFSQLMLLNQTGTPEGLALQASWAWVEQVRAASNTANSAIVAASTYQDILTIVTNYQTQLLTI
jgi:hypothetical protein